MISIISHENCQRGEYIFNENGMIVNSPLSHEYYKLYCLIMNKGAKIIDIYYPFLFFSSPQQLMEIIKIGLLAEHHKLHYLDLNIETPDKQKYILIYRHPADLENAYLRSYLTTKKPKNFIERLAFTWLRNEFSGVSDKVAKGNYLFIYYRRGFSPEILKQYYKKYPDGDLKNVIEEIARRYEFVKEYDEFKDFKEKMIKAKQLGKTILKEMRTEKGFRIYKQKLKNLPFVFPIKEALKTGVLTDEMKIEIKGFETQLNKEI